MHVFAHLQPIIETVYVRLLRRGFIIHYLKDFNSLGTKDFPLLNASVIVSHKIHKVNTIKNNPVIAKNVVMIILFRVV